MQRPVDRHCAIIFFFTDAATSEIYTLSLHDALPISGGNDRTSQPLADRKRRKLRCTRSARDRKSTRLNSSHGSISYAVFCLKKKNTRLRKAHRAMRSAPARAVRVWGLPRTFDHTTVE